MNDYFQSVILGIIEGLTEFLPVSSTAHLRLAQEYWLGIPLTDSYWKMFSIVIQLGAVLCLPIYFRREIATFTRSFFAAHTNEERLRDPLTLTAIAFVVTAVPAFLLSKVIGKHLEDVRIMGTALLIGGLVMWVVDALYARGMFARRGPGNTSITVSRTNDLRDMNIAQAVWIGACQILSAVFPGTSRSMSTIAAGQVAGMSRAAALEFSFFLSIPTMFAATGYDLFRSVHPK